MGKKVITPPLIADPTIEQVFDRFLHDQRERLKPRTAARYADVISLLRSYLNGYAYQALSPADSALFDKHFNATGEEHREFCQLFGPDKILEELGGFLGHFMIQKVMAGEDFKRSAGTVTKRLSKWLAEKGYVSPQAGFEAAEASAESARDLVAAECIAQVLSDATHALGVDPLELDDRDFVEFDVHEVARVEPGKLWLSVFVGPRRKRFGPIPIPKKATALLQEGWQLSCALGHVRGEWHIVEMGNVYLW